MKAPRLMLRLCESFARGARPLLRLCLASMVLSANVHAQTITGAKYAEATSEYPHAVLGDALEWKSLEITVSQDGTNTTHTLKAPKDMVFEDVSPRLWDVTGDGLPEVVVVQSHQRKGARLQIIGLGTDAVPGEIAATRHIGTRFRWLAPVGAADFDGDGHIEIAFVDRPHLAKTLRVWRYTQDSFQAAAHLGGVTNHKIGEDFISGGVRDCGSGPEMILADATWRNIVAVRLTQTNINGTVIAPFNGPASFDAALSCS